MYGIEQGMNTIYTVITTFMSCGMVPFAIDLGSCWDPYSALRQLDNEDNYHYVRLIAIARGIQSSSVKFKFEIKAKLQY